MTETRQASPSERAATALLLTSTLQAGEGALAGVLLEMLDRTEAMLAVKEMPSGRYVHVNARMAALFGRGVGEMIGATDTDLIEPGLWNSLRAAEQAALAQSGAVVSEHRVEQAGQRREFSVTRIATGR